MGTLGQSKPRVTAEFTGMGIVAGLDSSPDFTRIVVCDTDTGAVLRQGYAQHPIDTPDGASRPSDVDPQAWLLSLGEAAGAACWRACRPSASPPSRTR